MHNERAAAGLAHFAHKITHKTVAFRFIQTNAVLDRDRHTDGVAHGFDGISHQTRLTHQASTKRPALHTLTGATTIEIHFVITPVLCQLGTLSQVSSFTAAKLQRNRVLFGVKCQMPRHITMNQGTGGDHFCVKQGAVSDETVEIAAVTICPVEHGGHGKPPTLIVLEVQTCHACDYPALAPVEEPFRRWRTKAQCHARRPCTAPTPN